MGGAPGFGLESLGFAPVLDPIWGARVTSVGDLGFRGRFTVVAAP
ncbi:MAG: hypothetical protein QOF30_827 [Acidimicrobiaceae bacterium]|jgi:hypothetical protein|nr:hypothetical protein [Acidimicrobiaceae bacterium]